MVNRDFVLRSRLSVLLATALLCVVLLSITGAAFVIENDRITEEDENIKISITPHTVETPSADIRVCGEVTNKLNEEQTVNYATLFSTPLRTAELNELTPATKSVAVKTFTCSESLQINGSSKASCSESTSNQEVNYLDEVTQSLSLNTYNDSYAYYSSVTLPPLESKEFCWNMLASKSDASKKFGVYLWKGGQANPTWSLYLDPWWNTNWTNCKTATVTNPAPVITFTLNATQFPNISNSNGSLASLRITNGTCSNAGAEIPFWTEMNYWNSSGNNQIFVNTSNSTSFAIYYNNSRVSNDTNLSNLVIAGDEFSRPDSGTIGYDWSEMESGGSTGEILNGMLRLNTGTTNDATETLNIPTTNMLRVTWRMRGDTAVPDEFNGASLDVVNAVNFEFANGVLRTYVGGTPTTLATYSTNKWYKVDAFLNGSSSKVTVYVNDVLAASDVAIASSSYSSIRLRLFNSVNGASKFDYDNIVVTPWTGVATSVSIGNSTPLGLILADTYNVTSATGDGTIWRVSGSETVNTTTATPLVKFDLMQAANCSIGRNNLNYTSMIANDSTTQCATSQTTSMNCTLPASQQLSAGTQNIYISCRPITGGSLGNTSTSGALSIALSSSSSAEDIARETIDSVANAVLGSPTIDTDQQVYVRRVNNTQQLVRFDKVITFGNQHWAINYLAGNDTYSYMTNLTPVLYVYEAANISAPQLQTEVQSLIENTRN